MSFTLGINTGFAVNRFCEPRHLFCFIKEELNLSHIQLSTDLLSPYYDQKLLKQQVKKFKHERKRYSLNISSIFTGAYTRLNHLAHSDKEVQKFWIRWFKSLVDISAELECPTIGSHFGIFSYSDNDNFRLKKIRRSQNINNWHIIGNYARKSGLTDIIWEPMSIPREQGETISKCRKLQTDVNFNSPIPFKLCIDVDHGELTSKNKDDINPYAWLKNFAKDLKVVHLKQSLKDKGGHWPFTKKYNAKGKIIPKKVINTLIENGCHKAELVLELSFRERNPIDLNVLKEIKQSVNFWKKNKHIN